MSEINLASPLDFLRARLGRHPVLDELEGYAAWWEAEGKDISSSVDRVGTPWLRMFDPLGKRVDEILFPPGYWKMLRQGYRAGSVWRAFQAGSLLPSYLVGYVTAFYDTGLYCPYIVSLSTAVPLDKYGDAALKERFLPPLLRQDDSVWQGATWMTEAAGGSDLGAGVETLARPSGDAWLLTGDKYFASNAGADLAVVAARPQGAPASVRGLALFLLPRQRADGNLNYTIRRIKDKIGTRSVPTGEVELRDSQAYLLGKPEWGIYLILEALNLSRVANSIGSVALAQRALSEACSFAANRVAFGKPVLEQPLLKRQVVEQLEGLNAAFALAWEALRLLDQVWRETPPYPPRYQLFRLLTHLAKFWTADFAVRTARWAMEVYAGVGTLAEYGVERWLREALILPIWEGTPHRQILDGLETMSRKNAHRMLFEHLAPHANPHELEEVASEVDALLSLPQESMEAGSEAVFTHLAEFTARTLARNGL